MCRPDMKGELAHYNYLVIIKIIVHRVESSEDPMNVIKGHILIKCLQDFPLLIIARLKLSSLFNLLSFSDN